MKKILNDVSETKTLAPDAPFAIREAFNQLRTILMYTITDNENGAPVFAITSSAEDTGKSTIIANLAISFSQINKKVLLVDADLRRPVLHDYFGYDDKRQGLSDYISGVCDNVVISNVRENLDLGTSGRIPPNPSELLPSPRFTACLNNWKKEYDLIFIDFPPIGIVTDSVVNIGPITGYIFTVRAGRSTAKRINTSLEMMERLGAKIVGVVLNDYDIKGSGYYRHDNKYRYEKTDKKASKRTTKRKDNEKNAAEKADGVDSAK